MFANGINIAQRHLNSDNQAEGIFLQQCVSFAKKLLCIINRNCFIYTVKKYTSSELNKLQLNENSRISVLYRESTQINIYHGLIPEKCFLDVRYNHF